MRYTRRYRARKQAGTRVVSVEVTDRVVRALTDRGLISTANPDIGFSIRLLLTMFAAGIASVNEAQLAAITQAVGIAPQAGAALRSPPV